MRPTQCRTTTRLHTSKGQTDLDEPSSISLMYDFLVCVLHIRSFAVELLYLIIEVSSTVYIIQYYVVSRKEIN